MNVKKGAIPGRALCLVLASFLFGCKTSDQPDPAAAHETDDTAVHEAASDFVWNPADVVPITLNGSSITVGGAGSTTTGSTVTITSANSAPIYIKDSGKTIIGLADNTTNTLTDGTTFVYNVTANEART